MAKDGLSYAGGTSINTRWTVRLSLRRLLDDKQLACIGTYGEGPHRQRESGGPVCNIFCAYSNLGIIHLLSQTLVHSSGISDCQLLHVYAYSTRHQRSARTSSPSSTGLSQKARGHGSTSDSCPSSLRFFSPRQNTGLETTWGIWMLSSCYFSDVNSRHGKPRERRTNLGTACGKSAALVCA